MKIIKEEKNDWIKIELSNGKIVRKHKLIHNYFNYCIWFEWINERRMLEFYDY
jgi:hypothetical protein